MHWMEGWMGGWRLTSHYYCSSSECGGNKRFNKTCNKSASQHELLLVAGVVVVVVVFGRQLTTRRPRQRIINDNQERWGLARSKWLLGAVFSLYVVTTLTSLTGRLQDRQTDRAEQRPRQGRAEQRASEPTICLSIDHLHFIISRSRNLHP